MHIYEFLRGVCGKSLVFEHESDYKYLRHLVIPNVKIRLMDFLISVRPFDSKWKIWNDGDLKIAFHVELIS